MMLASVAVGVVMALAYHLSSTRSQLWLSKRASVRLQLLSVLTFILRLTTVGVIFYALRRWTGLDLIAAAITFVMGFTALSGYSLYRFAVKGRTTGPRPGSASPSSSHPVH